MAEKKTVLLRLNPKTWEELSRWAEDEFRSINGQIEYILHEAIQKKRKAKPSKKNDLDDANADKDTESDIENDNE